MTDILQLFSFTISPDLQRMLLPLKLPFILFDIALIGFFAFLYWKSSYRIYSTLDFREFLAYRAYGLHRIAGKWKKIIERLETAHEAEYKLAVLEADAMLEGILKRMGVEGENMTERLDKVTATMISTIQELREANRVRNSIVHDPDYRLEKTEARRILLAYQTTFQNLDLL